MMPSRRGPVRINMRARTKSFLVALVIAGVCMGGAVWLQESRQFPWGVFMAAIWVPLWTVIALEGGPHAGGGPWSWPLIFSLAVLMWWCLIECCRQLWRDWYSICWSCPGGKQCDSWASAAFFLECPSL